MKRLLLGLFLFVTIPVYCAVDITSFTANAKPYAFRGGSPNTSSVFTFIAEETDVGANGLTKLVFVLSAVTGTVPTDIKFDASPTGIGINHIDVLDSTNASIVTSFTKDTDSKATLVVNSSISQSASKTYTVHLTMGDAANLTETLTYVPRLQLESGEDSSSAVLGGAGLLTDRNFEVTGLDFSFNTDAFGNLIFDADATKFEMLDFVLTPQEDDQYKLDKITVSSSGTAQFDSGATQTNHGITKLYLYKDVDGSGDLTPGDEELKAIETFNNTDVTSNSAVIDLSSDLDSIRKLTGATRYLLLFDIGVSTNIELNDTARTVKAQITSITGTGVTSSLSYSPISITSNSDNNGDVNLAGMVIKSVENIFPSMNVAAGLTDIPILKFVAKSVGLKTRINKLVISNESKTFDSNSNQQGITNLSLVIEDTCDGTNVNNVDSCLGDYTGYGDDGPSTSPNLDTLLVDAALFSINDSSKATFTYQVGLVTDLDIATGKERAFYVLADFGSNMSAGQSVSLNISVDTRANHAAKGDIRIGSSLPLSVTPTQSITVVDPQLTIKTQFDVKIGVTDVGLFCDTDKTDNCSVDGGGAEQKLVAGMYDVRMYVMDIDVATSLSDVSFEFQSPNRYFSEESIGVSKLTLYLDKDKDGVLDSDDVFLGATTSFTNSGKTGTISGVSLPQGKDQKILLLFDLGQRVVTQSDQLSIQLSNVLVSGNRAAGMLPNPISPYTYDTVKHQLEIQSLETGISDDNVITQASIFDVTAVIKAMGDHPILQENGSTSVPLSFPKFYLDGVSGKNRTYEFSQTFADQKGSPVAGLFDVLLATNTKNLVYTVSAANITSEGNYLIDFDVYYQMKDDADDEFLESQMILLTRSKGAGTNYKSAVDMSSAKTTSKITPSMTTTNKVYTWTLPSYIESVEVKVNNNFVAFKNYQSVPQKAQLKVQFANLGQGIDPNSLALLINGVAVKAESQVSVGSNDIYYEYDTQTGELLVSSIGESSGTLTLSANDDFGQAYPSAPFIFYTSAALEIERFLVYPNPFSPSITTAGVTFGFSLTQAATVSIKIYDAMGRELSQVPEQSFSMGYNSISWNSIIASTSKYMPSGTYYLKLTATDAEGATKVATTKLAVY